MNVFDEDNPSDTPLKDDREIGTTRRTIIIVEDDIASKATQHNCLQELLYRFPQTTRSHILRKNTRGLQKRRKIEFLESIDGHTVQEIFWEPATCPYCTRSAVELNMPKTKMQPHQWVQEHIGTHRTNRKRKADSGILGNLYVEGC